MRGRWPAFSLRMRLLWWTQARPIVRFEIAKSFGAKVFVEPWKGFAGQKNSAIARCVGTWVLSLDADEELMVELQREISGMLVSDAETVEQVDGYRLRLRHVFLGRWMRHGGLLSGSEVEAVSASDQLWRCLFY